MEKFLYQRPLKKTPKINVWFSFPAIESFAMSSLGFLSIFKMLDEDRELYVERIYSDTKIIEINPKDVHCMGFSVSFELNILTVINMLKKYNFPLKSSQRTENDPIIFSGGPVLMSNPRPFEEFFDFISIGEKTCLKEAMEILKNKEKYSRSELLKQLSTLDGIYVPKYPKEKVKIVRDVIKNDIVYTPILSDNSYFKNTFIIEIERGCPKMCNFCLASWLNLPIRFVDYEKIIEAIDIGLENTNKIALLGAYVAGHPRFDDIIKYISKKAQTKNIELSISSLRADLTSIELVETLVKCNQKTATIALEAGSQRLRDFIKKDLNEKQVIETIKNAKLGGLNGLKIYVMIGLPTETDDDIEELLELIKKIKTMLKEIKGAFDVTISASTYIPKPHTPFEKQERCDKKVLENRINYLKKNFHKIGVNFKAPSVEWDIIQSILSRYDKDLSDFLIQVVENGANLGAFKQIWRKEFKKGNLPSLEECAKFPFQNNINALSWDFIDIGIEKFF